MALLLQGGDSLLLQGGDGLLLQQDDAAAYISAPGPLSDPAVLAAPLVFAQAAATSPLANPSVQATHTFGYIEDSTLGLMDRPRTLAWHQFGSVAHTPGPLSVASSAVARSSFADGLRGTEVEGYIVELTTPSGTHRIPISSWQSTLNVERSNYLQCVIPAANNWLDEINAATNFAIIRYVEFEGMTIELEMVSMAPTLKDFTQSPNKYTCVLSGYTDGYDADADPPELYDRDLQDIRLVNTSASGTRVRCAIDFLLRPAQRAWIDDETSFIVSYINYYINSLDAYMDVGERL